MTITILPKGFAEFDPTKLAQKGYILTIKRDDKIIPIAHIGADSVSPIYVEEGNFIYNDEWIYQFKMPKQEMSRFGDGYLLTDNSGIVYNICCSFRDGTIACHMPSERYQIYLLKDDFSDIYLDPNAINYKKRSHPERLYRMRPDGEKEDITYSEYGLKALQITRSDRLILLGSSEPHVWEHGGLNKAKSIIHWQPPLETPAHKEVAEAEAIARKAVSAAEAFIEKGLKVINEINQNIDTPNPFADWLMTTSFYAEEGPIKMAICKIASRVRSFCPDLKSVEDLDNHIKDGLLKNRIGEEFHPKIDSRYVKMLFATYLLFRAESLSTNQPIKTI